MKPVSQITIATAATIVFGAAVVAYAQTTTPTPGTGSMHGHVMGQGMGHGTGPGMAQGMGPGMPHGGPTAMLTRQDAQSAADMSLVMDLVHNNTQIRRNVTLLPDGIRTVTESDDPRLAQSIKAHVASMSARLNDGREFNLFSTTLPVIFDNASRIKSAVEMTDKGAIVTRTSADAKVVKALQAHAGEVSELVKDGREGFHRGMQARMAMGPGGPRGATSAPARPAATTPHSQHTH